jgi:hypothetical protein
VKSPTSATSTTALISAIPRIACNASTTGRIGKKAVYLFLDPLQAPFCVHNGIDIVLKCDLLSSMLEGQSR